MIDSPVVNAYVSKRIELCNGRVNSRYREVIGRRTPVCTYMYCHFIASFDNFVDFYLQDNSNIGNSSKEGNK